VKALDYVEFGIAQARRAWLRADQVANTRTLAQLKQLMKK
jgi:histidinol phosphatase-like PHP family hydrolase